MQARTVNECLNADEAMARLAAHAGRLLKLQRIIETTIPTALALSCRVANYKLGVVIIHADNGAVATKLRQIAPRLSDELRSSGSEITEIQIKVQPRDVAPTPSPGISNAGLSDQAKQGLTALSTKLPEGSSLKGALERLINRTKSSPKGTSSGA
jgi:hypothetical protein